MHVKRMFSHFMIWSLTITLLLSIVLAALPRSVQAGSPDVKCKESHVVQPGETIYRIAREYNVSVNRLAKTNHLTRPYLLIPGQTLCIPEKPQPSSKFTWTVNYSNNQIRISGIEFKKQHPFMVKVRENDTSPWFKLGKVLADSNGQMNVKYEVPSSLIKKSMLTVCLKDGITDYLYCKTVFKQ